MASARGTSDIPFEADADISVCQSSTGSTMPELQKISKSPYLIGRPPEKSN